MFRSGSLRSPPGQLLIESLIAMPGSGHGFPRWDHQLSTCQRPATRVITQRHLQALSYIPGSRDGSRWLHRKWLTCPEVNDNYLRTAEVFRPQRASMDMLIFSRAAEVDIHCSSIILVC